MDPKVAINGLATLLWGPRTSDGSFKLIKTKGEPSEAH